MEWLGDNLWVAWLALALIFVAVELGSKGGEVVAIGAQHHSPTPLILFRTLTIIRKVIFALLHLYGRRD